MTFIIKDGTGTGSTVKVDDDNRLLTRSTCQTDTQSALAAGAAYYTTTEIIELTSDTATAIYYIKNNEMSSLLSTSSTLFVGPSDGTGYVTYQFVGNATGGTLISNAVPGVSLNSNGSSSNTLDADLYRGVEGDTLTGGAGVTILLPRADAVYTQFGNSVLPKGFSGGVIVTPPAGNTSMSVCLVIEHILTEFI